MTITHDHAIRDDIFYLGDVLGEFAEDYDHDAILADWRAATEALLPDGWIIAGHLLVGPADQDFPDIATLAREVDLTPILERHER